MGLVLSCFKRCCCKKKTAEYKKLDTDLEGGGAAPDDAWSDFEEPELPPADAAPEQEEEEDPFADFGMAPQIAKTRRHNAPSVWEKAAPVSSRFAMAAAEEAPSDDAGWGGEQLDVPELSADARRKAAEARRQQRRAERGSETSPDPSKASRKVAATRTVLD